MTDSPEVNRAHPGAAGGGGGFVSTRMRPVVSRIPMVAPPGAMASATVGKDRPELAPLARGGSCGTSPGETS